jgi:ribosomal RNA-processing protein 17
MATVTIVEDFDPSSLIYGPAKTIPPQSNDAFDENPQPNRRPSAPRIKTKDKSKLKVSKKAKDIKYQTAAARKSDKRKQLKRHTEKAERAGGKQSRKSHVKRR